MALSLADAVTWASTQANVLRCTAAIQRAAVQVASSVMAKTPPLSSVDIGNIVFARKVFQGLEEAGKYCAWAVACDEGIDPTTITDADLVARIVANFHLYADSAMPTQ